MGALQRLARAARAGWRLSRSTLHVLHGLAIVRWRFPSLDEQARHARVAWWSLRLLKLMGLKLHAEGVPRPGAALLVANHVSWLDIAALHAVAPHARFVSKADVLRWPVLGRLTAGVGTLFIERERKRDALRVVHAIAEGLQAGQTVAVFPEGTTGDGRAVLPFHANLLQAAVATGTPVQPAVLRFATPGERFSAAVEYIGDTSLAQSMWRIACAEGLAVHVRLLPAVGTRHADRRALAAHLRSQIADVLAGAVPEAAPREGLAAAPAGPGLTEPQR